jgi:hypothetical protein
VPSDVVTWEACPACDGPVALGWVGQTVAEIDCAGGCRLTDALREAVRRTATRPAAEHLQPFDRSTCCGLGATAFPADCAEHGPQVPGDVLRMPFDG